MIGDRIKEVRIKYGMNQADFAKSLDLSQSAIANYEKNVRSPIDAVLRLICEKYSVNLNWLRTGEGDPFVKKSRSDEIFEYVERIQGVNENFKAQFAAALTALEEEDWKIILDVVNDIKEKSLAEKRKAEPKVAPATAATITDLTPEEQEIIRQHREKQKQMDA